MKIRTDLKAGKGLGDVVADVTHTLGIDDVAEAYSEASGKDCGCNARRAWLNEKFPNVLPG